MNSIPRQVKRSERALKQLQEHNEKIQLIWEKKRQEQKTARLSGT